jgi:H+/Cl- antiporter ClcA
MPVRIHSLINASSSLITIHRTWAQWRMANSLLLATIFRVLFVIVSYGCKVPAGIFIPSMAVGATFGRMIGILVKAIYRYDFNLRSLSLILSQPLVNIQSQGGLPVVIRICPASLLGRMHF